MQKTVVIILAVIALIVGALVYKTTREPALDRDVLSRSGIFLFDAPRSLPDVELTSAAGEPWTGDDLAGQWDLLFFGYTYCPDICPTTMAELREIENSLPQDQADQLQITMISVDPNRDTPERMREYLEYFSEDFNGASGDPEQLASLARALSIAYIEPDTSEENYLVDHSGQVVMVNPEGQYVGFLRAPLRPAELSQWLPRIMKQ
ncbi:SCO family protein [Pseudomonas sp. gcc21]|uniref:SCO family protein n=1 Tax=Pseudomonas sp. gcc21 TaxID=2726989 RepID=UPI001C499D3F|nr:SCO family protein [Pseudomonas sp. gcc21]